MLSKYINNIQTGIIKQTDWLRLTASLISWLGIKIKKAESPSFVHGSMSNNICLLEMLGCRLSGLRKSQLYLVFVCNVLIFTFPTLHYCADWLLTAVISSVIITKSLVLTIKDQSPLSTDSCQLQTTHAKSSPFAVSPLPQPQPYVQMVRLGWSWPRPVSGCGGRSGLSSV